MKRITLLVLLAGTVLTGNSLFANEADLPDLSELNGRYLKARVYRRAPEMGHIKPMCEPADRHCEMIELEIKNFDAKIDLSQKKKWALIVITPQDQQDPAVKKAWGNVIWTHPAGRWMGYNFREHRKRYAEPICLTFTDALGDKIEAGRIEVSLNSCDGVRPLIFEGEIDRQGRALVPEVAGYYGFSRLNLSHPNLGRLVLSGTDMDKSETFILPVVKQDNKSDARTARGVILDDAGEPVADARMYCKRILFPGDGKIQCRYGSHYWSVFTDAQGRFSLCMPDSYFEQVPQEAFTNLKYYTYVKPPKVQDMPGYHIEAPLGHECVFTLTRPDAYYRTFVFKDNNTVIKDPNRLKKLGLVVYTNPGGSIRYNHFDIRNGGWFPVGIYRPWIERAGKANLRFEQKKVTKDSPKELVFQTEKPWVKMFIGRAFLGFTDRAAQGAFVVLAGIGQNNNKTVGMISDDNWQQMQTLKGDISADEPALEPLRNIWYVEKVLRTGADGRFEVKIPKKQNVEFDYKICVIQQGYMPVYHKLYHLEQDPNDIIELPASRLIPAARVRFELVHRQTKSINAHMSWDLEQQQGRWYQQFCKYKSVKGVWFPLHQWITCQGPYVVSVPADISLRLNFQMKTNDPQNILRTPVYTPIINGRAGEFIDLGRIEMERTIPVCVQVVDSDNNPVPGVGVKHCKMVGGDFRGDYRYFGQTKITDELGLAVFEVPVNFEATFLVSHYDEHQGRVRQGVNYNTNSPEDANSIYTLQLSDEMIQMLFGEKTEK